MIKVTKTDDNGVSTVTEYLCKNAKSLVEGAATQEIVWNTEGDTHTTTIEFTDNGDYVVEIAYADFSENGSKIEDSDKQSSFLCLNYLGNIQNYE